MGAGASANAAKPALGDLKLDDIADCVANVGAEFEEYSYGILDQEKLDGKYVADMSAEQLEQAMEELDIKKAHRDVLKQRLEDAKASESDAVNRVANKSLEGPHEEARLQTFKGESEEAYTLDKDASSIKNESDATAGTAESLRTVAYKISIQENNRNIIDSLSGEKLDTTAQSVNVVSAAAGEAGDEEAISYVQRKLVGEGRVLESNEPVLVQLDERNALAWLQGVVDQGNGETYGLRFNKVPFKFVDPKAREIFDNWVRKGAEQSEFKKLSASDAAQFQSLNVEIQLKGSQYRNRTLDRVQLECTGDSQVVLHFPGVSIVASDPKSFFCRQLGQCLVLSCDCDLSSSLGLLHVARVPSPSSTCTAL